MNLSIVIAIKIGRALQTYNSLWLTFFSLSSLYYYASFVLSICFCIYFHFFPAFLYCQFFFRRFHLLFWFAECPGTIPPKIFCPPIVTWFPPALATPQSWHMWWTLEMKMTSLIKRQHDFCICISDFSPEQYFAYSQIYHVFARNWLSINKWQSTDLTSNLLLIYNVFANIIA